eukprot:TRINITY_DN19648_c0_g1_i3.p1 TRINITY_DN19648_c0_g1~~TRINITY_DN19648_c0_g1_i3.p1  ORF type:complete len:362 (-),score=17.48 TRINITY_DN19648_c0_g1_i3:17-1102(-)
MRLQDIRFVQQQIHWMFSVLVVRGLFFTFFQLINFIVLFIPLLFNFQFNFCWQFLVLIVFCHSFCCYHSFRGLKSILEQSSQTPIPIQKLNTRKMQNSKDNLDSQTNPFPSYQALSKNYDEIWYNQSNNQVQIKNQNDKFLSDKWITLIIIILVPSLGLVLGVIVPPSENLPFPYDKISSIIGWTYFSAWSISFYPQVYTNFMRKSVVGLSLDFNLLNMLGFACYSCFNCVIFWDAGVQKQYLVTHPGGSVGVQINDIFFALHAFTICGIILIQCLIYDRGNQGFSKIALVACGIFVVGASIWSLLIYFTSNQNNISQQYLVLLYVLSSGQTLGVTASRFRGHTSPHRNVKEKKKIGRAHV